MTQLLKDAINQVRELTPREQDRVAEVVLSLLRGPDDEAAPL
jgi:hypothetical protein